MRWPRRSSTAGSRRRRAPAAASCGGGRPGGRQPLGRCARSFRSPRSARTGSAALRDVRAVIADALASAPTQEEIDREVAEMELAFQVPVEQKRLLPGFKARRRPGHRGRHPRDRRRARRRARRSSAGRKPLFTPEAVLDHTRTLFAGTVTRAILVTPKAGEGDGAALRQAMLEPATGRYRRAACRRRRSVSTRCPPIGAARPGHRDRPDRPHRDRAGRFRQRRQGADLAGARRAGPGHGQGALRRRLPQPSPRATRPISRSARWRWSARASASSGQEELDRISTGRKMGFDFRSTTPRSNSPPKPAQADLADQLYLFAAKFAMPRWDANPVLRAKAAARLQYEAYVDLAAGRARTRPQVSPARPRPALPHADPGRDRQGDARRLPPGVGAGAGDRADRSAGLRRFRPQRSDRGACNARFGALAPRPPLPAGTAPRHRALPGGQCAAGGAAHRGDANQAAAVVSWPTGGGIAGVRESRQLEILTQLFTNRLMDRMREKLGASYAPQVFSDWPLDLDSGGSITALAQLQPAAVPAFFAAARRNRRRPHRPPAERRRTGAGDRAAAPAGHPRLDRLGVLHAPARRRDQPSRRGSPRCARCCATIPQTTPAGDAGAGRPSISAQTRAGGWRCCREGQRGWRRPAGRTATRSQRAFGITRPLQSAAGLWAAPCKGARRGEQLDPRRLEGARGAAPAGL